MSDTETGAPGTDVEAHEHHLPAMTSSGIALLPGEVAPHPTPFKYVMIAVVLVIITAAEVGMYYLAGEIPNWLITVTLLIMAGLKFFTVAAWYMHLKTDKPIFRRFFIIGLVGAVVLFLIVLATLGAIS